MSTDQAIPATPPLQPPTEGKQRNAHWRVIQFVLQNFFGVWLGYRAVNHEALEQLTGGLVLANHQSYLDPLLVGLPLKRPVSYLARDSLFHIPIIGYILRNTYVLPINREAAGTASLREMLSRMDKGYLVGIFPEGTRTLDGQIGELKPGFIALLRRSKQPVIPVGIAGAFAAYPKGAWWIRPARVRVVYGQPIYPDELAQFGKRDDDKLLAFIRTRLVTLHAQAEAWRQGQQNHSSPT